MVVVMPFELGCAATGTATNSSIAMAIMRENLFFIGPPLVLNDHFFDNFLPVMLQETYPFIKIG
jgi:hypothetical protein